MSCRAAHELVLACILPRRRPHPGAWDGHTIEGAVLPRHAKRTEVSARAYGPARTVGTGDCRSARSCVGEVEALPALTSIRTCLSVKASSVRAKGARQAADKGFGVGSGIVCILRTGIAGLRACLFLILAGCARRPGLANLLLALTSLRTRKDTAGTCPRRAARCSSTAIVTAALQGPAARDAAFV